MDKRKLIYWIIQFSAWGFICIIIGIANFIQSGYSIQTVIQLLMVFTLLILSSHAIREIFIRRDWFNLSISKLILYSFILIITLSTCWLAIFNSVNWLLFEERQSFGTFIVNVILYSIFLILWTAVYLANHLLRKSHIQELNNLKLQTSQSQNELKALRDQLNPHFLFNSLNNIRALIEIDPHQAKNAITTLSSLLRSSLLLGKRSYILLQDELKLVSEYLELEKIRFEERLSYDFINKVDQKVYIPPFIIQSMVENAIKHGTSKSSTTGKVLISIFFKDDNLLMEVENDGKFVNNNGAGIGIFNTKRRLEILYGKDAGFEIRDMDGKVKASVWINKKHLNQLQYESIID